VGRNKILEGGRCVDAAAGFVAEKCSNQVKRCDNADYVSEADRGGSVVSMWPGTCSLRVDKWLSLAFSEESAGIVNEGTFTIDFDVSVDGAMDVTTGAVTRIMGVENTWSLALKKKSGAEYTFVFESQALFGPMESESVHLTGRGLFRLVVTNKQRVYLLAGDTRVILRFGMSSELAFAGGKHATLEIGPEDKKITWNYAVGLRRLVKGAFFGNNDLQPAPLSSSVEVWGPLSVVQTKDTLTIGSLKFKTETPPDEVYEINPDHHRGYLRLGTGSADPPISTDPRSRFFSEYLRQARHTPITPTIAPTKPFVSTSPSPEDSSADFDEFGNYIDVEDSDFHMYEPVYEDEIEWKYEVKPSFISTAWARYLITGLILACASICLFDLVKRIIRTCMEDDEENGEVGAIVCGQCSSCQVGDIENQLPLYQLSATDKKVLDLTEFQITEDDLIQAILEPVLDQTETGEEIV
jgi:hypothetical protein